jgi:hypothetical protein
VRLQALGISEYRTDEQLRIASAERCDEAGECKSCDWNGDGFHVKRSRKENHVTYETWFDLVDGVNGHPQIPRTQFREIQ